MRQSISCVSQTEPYVGKSGWSERIVSILQDLRPDVAFNALHGKWGEDGCCAAMLETLQIPCTGTPAVPLNFVADLFESLTGEPLTAADLRASADRDYLLRYLFNLRTGYRPEFDILPGRILKQMQQADPRWNEDWPKVKQVFYDLKGFDGNGFPTPETVGQAGLEQLVTA